MPTAPPARCTAPGCTTLTPHGRCPHHQRKPWASRSKAWGNGSTRAWRKTRARQLTEHPACRLCGNPATEVDHIRPRSEGGAFLDPRNLRSLCTPCHDTVTRAQASARNQRGA